MLGCFWPRRGLDSSRPQTSEDQVDASAANSSSKLCVNAHGSAHAPPSPPTRRAHESTAAQDVASSPFGSLSLSQASQINHALTMVQSTMQQMADLRQENALLRSLQQALKLIVAEWPSALARIHVVSKQSALLLAMAPAAPHGKGASVLGSITALHPTAPHFGGRPVACAPLSALSCVLEAKDGSYSWFQGEDVPLPLDYEPYATAGARAIVSVVLKLPAAAATNTTAILTLAFASTAADLLATHHHGLWSTYVKLIASGMTALLVGSMAPKYLAIAQELGDAHSLEFAVASVVRWLRGLLGPTGSQLCFRVALMPPNNPGHAVLFDLPSEVPSGLISRRSSLIVESNSTGKLLPSCRPPRLSGLSREGSIKSASFWSTLGMSRAASTPSRSQLPHPHSGSHLPHNSSGSGCSTCGNAFVCSGVVRTVVATPQTLLKHVVDKCQQVVVPDLLKLLNQGGMVAADIYSINDIRPPASVLLLPLLRTGEDGQWQSCYGAVYCMSAVQTEFPDVKQQLCEAIVEVLSPHLFAALSREPLATEYLLCKAQQLTSQTLSMSDLAVSLDTCAAAMIAAAGKAAMGPKQAVSGATSPAVTSPAAPAALPPLPSAGGKTTTTPSSRRTSQRAADRTPMASPFASVAGSDADFDVFAAVNTSVGSDVGGGGAASAALAWALGNGSMAGGGGGEMSSRSSCTDMGVVSSGPVSCTSALVTGLTDKISMHRTMQSMDAASTTNLEDLQFLGLLGSGGFAYVFRGKWCGMMVAIKLVKCPKVEDDAARAALKHAHEIAILTSVSHPNIIQAYAFMTDVKVSDVFDVCMPAASRKLRDESVMRKLRAMEGDLCHIEVLELCDQGTVVDALQRGSFSEHVAMTWELSKQPLFNPRAAGASLASSLPGGATSPNLQQQQRGSRGPVPEGPMLQSLLLSLVELASALAHLHSLGIVHCDIKPDNVLIKSSTSDARGFTFKLADFGLSRVQDDQCLTFPCNSCGTLAYVAPEALTNRKVDSSIDVYSFGILMYELYSNRRPYGTMKQEELLHGVVTLGLRPTFRGGCHPQYVELAKACWAPMSEDRPRIEEVLQALHAMLTMLPQPALKLPSPLGTSLPR